MKITNKEYSLSLYHHQGDDFRHYLDENQSNVSAALRDWALQLKLGYDTCMRLASAFEDRDVYAFADAYHISFEPGNDETVGLLEMLAREDLVNIYEFEDEEAEDDEDSDDDDEDSDEEEDEDSDEDDIEGDD